MSNLNERAALHGFFCMLSEWLDNQKHGDGCDYGHVVQSGPMEGNKIPCTCGLTELQHATNAARDSV